MQSQRPFTTPNHIISVVFVIARDRSSTTTISSREAQLCSSASFRLNEEPSRCLYGASQDKTSEELGPIEECQDRIRAEEGDSGEHRSSKDDWKLYWQETRHASASQRPKHAKQREDGEETQQIRSLLIIICSCHRYMHLFIYTVCWRLRVGQSARVSSYCLMLEFIYVSDTTSSGKRISVGFTIVTHTCNLRLPW